jgi:hypothetical protein
MFERLIDEAEPVGEKQRTRRLGCSISPQSRWIAKDQVCRTGGDFPRTNRQEMIGSAKFVLPIVAPAELVNPSRVN